MKEAFLMWTDAHIHLYDTRRTTVTWPPATLGFPSSVYVPDFLAIAEPCGISRMVSVECTVGAPEEVDNWTLTLTRHDPAVAAVIACADMTSPGFEAVHGRYLAFPKYRGIRVNAVPAEKLPMFRENLALMAATRARVVDVLADPKGILTMLPAMEEAKDITFVLNHIPGCTVCGEPQSPETEEFLHTVGRLPNVNMKVSSFVTKSDIKPAPDDVQHYAHAFRSCLHAFGTKRCMFGSDWPVLEMKGQYNTAVQVLTRWLAPMGMDVTDDVMGSNCERIYDADMEGV